MGMEWKWERRQPAEGANQNAIIKLASNLPTYLPNVVGVPVGTRTYPSKSMFLYVHPTTRTRLRYAVHPRPLISPRLSGLVSLLLVGG